MRYVMPRFFFLDRIAADSKVLILGGGSGWLLEELSKINTDVTVVYVEASKVMLTKAKKYANLPLLIYDLFMGLKKT